MELIDYGERNGGEEVVNKVVHMWGHGGGDDGGGQGEWVKRLWCGRVCVWRCVSVLFGANTGGWGAHWCGGGCGKGGGSDEGGDGKGCRVEKRWRIGEESDDE